MAHCLSNEQIESYLSGHLPQAEESDVREHLEGCATCALVLEQIRSRHEETRSSLPSNPANTPTESHWPEAEVVGGGGSPRGDSVDALDPRIPGYRILALIDEGGQGTVYKAVQTATNRIVALKVLRPSRGSKVTVQRFQREVELVAGLDHPNIVTVFDSGFHGGRHYYSMAFVDGRTLTQYLARNELSVGEIERLFYRIAVAVGYAQAHGVVHRDLKPGNVLVDSDGEPHILDFGLAKVIGPDRASSPLTVTGEFMGTLAYASPEQTTGNQHAVDARSDVYAIGVMLFEALTGTKPYKLIDDLNDILRAITTTVVEAPSKKRHDIDRDLDVIVLKALSKEPVRRYETATALADDLKRHLEGRAIHGKPESAVYLFRRNLARRAGRSPVVAAFLVVFLSIAVGFVFLTSRWLARPIDRPFELFALSQLQATGQFDWPEDIAFIALDDATFMEIPEIAEREGASKVNPRDLRSLRVLHGAMMERLATASPRVIVWDIRFTKPAPAYDADLVRGIESVRDGGAAVILAANEADGVSPRLSPAVAASADGWGWLHLGATKGAIRSVVLAVDEAPYPITPSLSLRAYAAWRHPDCSPEFVWHARRTLLEIRYVERGESSAETQTWRRDRDFVHIAHVGPLVHTNDRSSKPAAGARVAYVWATLPDESALMGCTTSYRDVFQLDSDALAARFRDKIVVVADNRMETTRSRPDRQFMADRSGGRETFSCYLHGAALSSLLGQVQAERPGAVLECSMLLSCSLLGLAVALLMGRLRRAWVWLLGACVLAVLVVGACYALAINWRLVASVASLVLTAWLAFGGGLIIATARKRSRPAIAIE